MSALPYHKRYHSDALAGMMSLTLEERGAYNTLLDMMYDRGGPLIDNERLLAGYMNCSIRKWRALREILIEKRKIRINSHGLITNGRTEKEIENTSKTHRKRVEWGSKGGRTRAENEKKGNENNEGDQGNLEATSSDPQAISEARSQSSVSKDTSQRAWKIPDGVPEEVWADFLKNRKTKRMPNTDTAWKKFNDDLARVGAATGLPPPKLIEQCTAKGWGGIYDPRENGNGQSSQQRNGSGNQPVDGLSTTTRAALRVFGAGQ